MNGAHVDSISKLLMLATLPAPKKHKLIMSSRVATADHHAALSTLRRGHRASPPRLAHATDARATESRRSTYDGGWPTPTHMRAHDAHSHLVRERQEYVRSRESSIESYETGDARSLSTHSICRGAERQRKCRNLWNSARSRASSSGSRRDPPDSAVADHVSRPGNALYPAQPPMPQVGTPPAPQRPSLGESLPLVSWHPVRPTRARRM